MRVHLTLSLSLAALAAVSIVLTAARADEERRELGAHVHGHGTLNIAIEGNRVAMELEAPGMDIVGFEHGAQSDAQQAAVEKAKAELAQPLALFKLPNTAGCSSRDVKVEIETEHEDDDHAKAEDHDQTRHADGDHDDENGGHNAFHATYALNCAKPDSLTSITFDYFKSFAGANGLTVNVVTVKAQSKYEVSRDKPNLDLGGMM